MRRYHLEQASLYLRVGKSGVELVFPVGKVSSARSGGLFF